MKNLLAGIRKARQEQNLSQQRLAARAGVSLATVQNLESGEGNPELSTIQSILEALALEISLKPKPVDIETLAQLGAPLLSSGAVSSSLKLHPLFLINELLHISAWLPTLDLQSREANALAAYLSAIDDHYGSVWDQLSPVVKSWFKKYPNEISPKLRRLSLQRLGEFL